MKLPGIPEELAQADLVDGSVTVTLDSSIYPLEAIYGASFVFIERAFVFVHRPTEGEYRVVLRAKSGPFDEDALGALAGELANELLCNAWRHQITKDNRATIEAVTMQAIAGAMGPPSLDELEDFDFSEEPFDDPLGIAQSWEDKYKKTPEGDA